MYAAGTAIRPLRSEREPALGHVGRLGLVFALIVLVAAWSLARVALRGAEPAYATVVVQPGDTLWSIAQACYPGADPRERVDAIERLNGLSGPGIQAGETLELPPA